MKGRPFLIKFRNLSDYIVVPERKPNIQEVFHTYVIRASNRNELVDYLIGHGIEVKVHYPVPLHLQKAAESLGYKKGDFPKAEKQSKELLTLPIHQYLSKKQINYIAQKIQNFYGK